VGDPFNSLEVQNNYYNPIIFTVNSEEGGNIPSQAKQTFVGFPVDPDESEAQKNTF
jgi:hypothetical protein